MPKTIDVILKARMTIPDDMPMEPFKASFRKEVVEDLNGDSDMEEEWRAEDLFPDVPPEYLDKRWVVKFEKWVGTLEDPETGESV